MPELAEVALYARDLNNAIASAKLRGVSFPNRRDWGQKIIPPRIQRLLSGLIGERITFYSKGKALYVSNNVDPVAEFRLGMTGQFHRQPLLGKWKRHCFLNLEFDGFTLNYADPRRFGRVKEPLENNSAIGGYNLKNGFWLQKQLILPFGYLTRPRISWLLGTGDRTGIGNYLANEALGIMRLSPFEPCRNESEAVRLLKKCGEIARKSFAAGGNSFGTKFYDIDGIEGKYSELCRFYQNAKVPRMMYRGRPLFTHFKSKD